MSVVESRDHQRMVELLQICLDAIENPQPERSILLAYPNQSALIYETHKILDQLGKHADMCGFTYSKLDSAFKWATGSKILMRVIRDDHDLSRLQGIRLLKWQGREGFRSTPRSRPILDSRVR